MSTVVKSLVQAKSLLDAVKAIVVVWVLLCVVAGLLE